MEHSPEVWKIPLNTSRLLSKIFTHIYEKQDFIGSDLYLKETQH